MKKCISLLHETFVCRLVKYAHEFLSQYSAKNVRNVGEDYAYRRTVLQPQNAISVTIM